LDAYATTSDKALVGEFGQDKDYFLISPYPHYLSSFFPSILALEKELEY
jgi:hypothetical protein